MSTSARALSGMQYLSVELKHDVSEPTSSVLRDLADWLQENDHEHGILTSLTTQNDADDDSTFLTTLVWAY